jgi:hypothetical protein
MATTPGERTHRGSRRRGIALVIGIFVFGAAMMALLFRAPRTSDRAPDLPMAPPRRALRVISLNVRARPEDGRTIGQWLKRLDADVYMLQGVRAGDVASIGKELGMSRPAGDVFYPAQNLAGPSAPFGNAIFSRFALYASRSIPSRGGSFGVWAVIVVDDVQFLVASLDTTDTEAAEGRGATADVERRKELTMLVEAFAATRQATAIIGAHAPGWNSADEMILRPSATTGASERLIVLSNKGDADLKLEPIALPRDSIGEVVGAKIERAVSGG